MPQTTKTRHFPSYLRKSIRQEDAITGAYISPHYLPPTSPSLVFTPPGVPIDTLPYSAGFISKFSRMDPLAAKEMREHWYRGQSGEQFTKFTRRPELSSGSMNFTFVSLTPRPSRGPYPRLGRGRRLPN